MNFPGVPEMPPLRMNPVSQDAPTTAAVPLAPAGSPTARQFKILQSRRAPAQLTLGLRRG
jgi:hypothetical protein